MTKNETILKPEHFGDETVPAFGYELIRSLLLPELLGKEAGSILYWSGRKLARLYPMDSEEAITSFFRLAAWGELTLTQRGKSKIVFECQSPLVESRIKDHPDAALYSLEAGFLAEQVQKIHGYIAEAYPNIRSGRHKMIVFEVKWDTRDVIEPQSRSKK